MHKLQLMENSHRQNGFSSSCMNRQNWDD